MRKYEKADVVIPKGWGRIRRGKVREGDRCFIPSPMRWGFTDRYDLGKPVSRYIVIIRPKPTAPDMSWQG